MKIYLASSVSTFHTQRYHRMIAYAHQHYPDAHIRPAQGLYSSSQDWLARWPDVLSQIDEIVFFTNEHGYIGRGVYREINDCHLAGKSVHMLTDDGQLHSYDDVELSEPDDTDWIQHVQTSIMRQPSRKE